MLYHDLICLHWQNNSTAAVLIPFPIGNRCCLLIRRQSLSTVHGIRSWLPMVRPLRYSMIGLVPSRLHGLARQPTPIFLLRSDCGVCLLHRRCYDRFLFLAVRVDYSGRLVRASPKGSVASARLVPTAHCISSGTLRVARLILPPQVGSVLLVHAVRCTCLARHCSHQPIRKPRARNPRRLGLFSSTRYCP